MIEILSRLLLSRLFAPEIAFSNHEILRHECLWVDVWPDLFEAHLFGGK